MAYIAAASVAGKEPGETLTDADLDGLNVPALLASGAITKNTPTKKKEEE